MAAMFILRRFHLRICFLFHFFGGCCYQQRSRPQAYSHSPQEDEDGGSASKKQRKTSVLSHTAKEKLRRASIVTSCNKFRLLVPSVKDADKATVFRTSVEFLAFLRTHLSADELNKLDREFADTLSLRLQKDSQLARLDAQPVLPANVHHVEEDLQCSDIFLNQVGFESSGV